MLGRGRPVDAVGVAPDNPGRGLPQLPGDASMKLALAPPDLVPDLAPDQWRGRSLDPDRPVAGPWAQLEASQANSTETA
jgi:hypothetical protein